MILKRGNITPAACANGLHTVTAKKTHARKRTERNGKNAISRNGTPIPERDGSRKEMRRKMMKINSDNYTKKTYKHVPNGYHMEIDVIGGILEKNERKLVDSIIYAWEIGFEAAYRAAKHGKLDFQQENKESRSKG